MFPTTNKLLTAFTKYIKFQKEENNTPTQNVKKKIIDFISSLNRGRTDWKLKVKVIRFWRGATITGKTFKSFNVILIDEQVSYLLICQ